MLIRGKSKGQTDPTGTGNTNANSVNFCIQSVKSQVTLMRFQSEGKWENTLCASHIQENLVWGVDIVCKYSYTHQASRLRWSIL